MEYEQRTVRSRTKRTTSARNQTSPIQPSVPRVPGQALADALARQGVFVTVDEAARLATTLLRFVEQGLIDSPASAHAPTLELHAGSQVTTASGPDYGGEVR